MIPVRILYYALVYPNRLARALNYMKKQLIKKGLRKCYYCKRIFPLTKEYFSPSKLQAKGLGYLCKKCQRDESYKKYRRKEDLRRYHENPKERLQKRLKRKEYVKIYNGYLYVVKIKNYYKIGKTNNISNRLRDIRSCSPFRVMLIFSKKVKDVYGIEADLHWKFQNKRIRREWFKLNEIDLLFIKDFLEQHFCE